MANVIINNLCVLFDLMIETNDRLDNICEIVEESSDSDSLEDINDLLEELNYLKKSNDITDQQIKTYDEIIELKIDMLNHDINLIKNDINKEKKKEEKNIDTLDDKLNKYCQQIIMISEITKIKVMNVGKDEQQ